VDLKERAQNIGANYRDLREYIYVMKLLLEAKDIDDIRDGCIWTQFCYLSQMVDMMNFDLKHLIASVYSPTGNPESIPTSE